jgi:lysozyme family protein
MIGSAIFGKIADTAKAFAGKASKYRTVKHGNQENREQRKHDLAMAGLAYRKKFVTKALFTLASLPLVLIWFMVMSTPLINLWANYIEFGFTHEVIRLLAVDYMSLWNTLGTTFIVGFITQIAGMQGLKAANNVIDFKLKKAKTKVVIETKKMEVEIVKATGEVPKKDPFDIAFPLLMGHEGFHSYDSNDKGGETICGISRKWWGNWVGWVIVDAKKKANKLDELKHNDLFNEAVKSFYLTNFWKKLKCDKLPEAIALEIFDSAVNCGSSNAVKFLQRAINNNNYKLVEAVKVDGGFGSATLEALNVFLPKYEKAMLISMNGEQYEHYQKIIEKDTSQKKYFRGWMNRVAVAT